MIRIISVLAFAFFTATAQADTVKLADNAPDSYKVVKGDTLWDISGKFLKHPWLWPQVWRLNREQIRNPHWIYPGQVIYLDRSGPYLTLKKPGSHGGDTLKLHPQVRSEGLNAIPSVPLHVIEPFLTRPLLIAKDDLAKHGTIVATQENRLLPSKGDTVYAKNITKGISDWQVYQRAEALKDPVTGELLGYEANYLGAAQVTEEGTPATLEITSIDREIGIGDRLLPAVDKTSMSFVPHAPEGKLNGRIVKMHDTLEHAGKNSVLAINLGSRAGIEPGHVLALYRSHDKVKYDLDGKKEEFKLPEERIGLIFVFRVFDRVSYAIVMESTGVVKVADSVRQP
jgi:hypothetical protein